MVGAVPEATVDVAQYQEKRDLLCDALQSMGYDAPRPQGAFYVFATDADPRRHRLHRPAAAGGHSGRPRHRFRPSGLHAPLADHYAGGDRPLPARLRARYRVSTFLGRTLVILPSSMTGTPALLAHALY